MIMMNREQRSMVNFYAFPLDEENQGDLTNERIKNWVEQLKGEFN